MKKSTTTETISILELISNALSQHGLRPRVFGRFARIQAFWRNSKDYNISINLERGTWTDFVSGETSKPFSELVELLGIDKNNIPTVKSSPVGRGVELSGLQRKRSALTMWEKGSPLNDVSKPHVMIARRYIESRGIPLDPLSKILPKLRCLKRDENGSTLMFPIFSPIGNHDWIGIQRISLDKDGKKVGDDAKRMLGSHFVANKAGGFLLAGDSDRFTKKILAICEGPETGLAIRAATGMPVYIMYNAGALTRISVDFLSELGVTEVLIASDNDDPIEKLDNIQPGQKAAYEAAEKISKESGSPVRVSIPPRNYGGDKNADWLDVLEKNPVGMANLLFSSLEYIPEHKRQNNSKSVVINKVFSKKKKVF